MLNKLPFYYNLEQVRQPHALRKQNAKLIS